MKKYPYDYTSTAETNKFRCEFIVTAEVNSDRVLVPALAPFYEEGLIISLPNTEEPLKRGYDYELVKPLYKIHKSVRSPAWFAIQLTNPKILGRLIVDGQTVGEDFIDPTVDIFDELVKYLNNPNVVYYSNVENKPQLYPASKAVSSWDDLLNKKYIASAIEDIGGGIVSNIDSINDLLEEFKIRIAAILKVIGDFDYKSHIDAFNPHEVTLDQLHMFGINDTAKNSKKLAGLSINKLAEYIISKDVKKVELEDYIDRWISKAVTGEFKTTNPDIVVIDDKPRFTIDDDKNIIIRSSNGVVITAGYDFDGNDYISFKAGDNVLKLVSSGDDIDMYSLTYNDYPLISARNIHEWQETSSEAGLPKFVLRAEGVREFNTFGEGTEDNPFIYKIRYNKSSSTTSGVAILADDYEVSNSDYTYVATPKALNKIITNLAKYVDGNFTINGKLNTSISKKDINLDKVDNTPDLYKPITNAEQELLDAKALVGHIHDWKETGYTTATKDSLGVIKKNTLDDLNNGKFVGGIGVEAYVVNKILDDINNISGETNDNTPPFNTIYIGELNLTKAEINDNYVIYKLDQSNYYYKSVSGNSEDKSVNGVIASREVKIPNTNNLQTSYWYKKDRTWFFDKNIRGDYETIFKNTVNDFGKIGIRIKFYTDSSEVSITLNGNSGTEVIIYTADDGNSTGVDLSGVSVTKTIESSSGDYNYIYLEVNGDCYGLSIKISDDTKVYYESSPDAPSTVDYIILNKNYLNINTDYFISYNIRNDILIITSIQGTNDEVSSDVSTYIGSIRIDGTFPETIKLDKTILFGSYKELEYHLDDKNSHNHKHYDINIANYAENYTDLKPLINEVTTYKNSNGDVIGESYPSLYIDKSNIANDSFVATFNVNDDNVNTKISLKIKRIGYNTLLSNCFLNNPLRWVVKNNPFENYMDTHDGQIHINTKPIDKFESFSLLIGFGDADNNTCDAKMVEFIIKSDNTTAHKTFDLTINYIPRYLYASCDITNLSEEISNTKSTVTHEDSSDVRYISAYYRLIPELKILRVLLVFNVNGKKTYAVHKVDYDSTELKNMWFGGSFSILDSSDTDIPTEPIDPTDPNFGSDDSIEISTNVTLVPTVTIFPTIIDHGFNNEFLSKFNFLSPLMYGSMINNSDKMDIKSLPAYNLKDNSTFKILVTNNDIVTNYNSNLPWYTQDIENISDMTDKTSSCYCFDTPMSLTQHNLDYVKSVLKYEKDILNIKLK